jgi:hypothetical protein
VNPTDDMITGCGPYRSHLRSLKPSQALDQRIATSIAREASRRARSPWLWTLAASAAGVASVLGISLALRSSDVPPASNMPAAASEPSAALSPADGTLPVSYWPVEASVVRVRGRLATQPAERQYWLDVRLARDGSMRIVRVIPVNPSDEGSYP